MKLVIDLTTNTVVGGTTDNEFALLSNQVLIQAPEDFEMESSSEWSYDGVGITRDSGAALDRSKTARKARIKHEAKALIEALDWRVTRARERAEAGIAYAGETVAEVLAMRESIRFNSTAAELAVDALTDVASVQSFSWSVI
jgi:hypothetical protein